MKKTILIATGLYPPESGGPATYAKLLEERLPALDFSVSVLPFRTVRHLPKIIRHLAYFFTCVRMARSADIVYALDTVSVGLPAALAAGVMRKKFVVRVPGDYAWEQARQRFGVEDELDEFQKKSYGLRVGFLRAVQRFVVSRACAVIVPSEYMKKIVSGWLVPSQVEGVEKIKVIYSSIDLAAAYELPARRPEGFLVVSSGRRVPWKNFDGIARAVAREKRWHLFIAEGLPRAQALGWVKSADAFVLNSTYEGLSHALIEAMALGTPIVATAVGGNPELIEDGVDGLCIPPNDDAALHAALKKIEQDKVAARARAEAARAKSGTFSINRTLEQLTTLFKTWSSDDQVLKVLMVTGDKNFSASPRFALQAAQVDKLEVVYMGKGSVWPKIPEGFFDVVTAQDPFWRGLFAWWVASRTGAKLNIQVHTDLSAQGFLRRRLANFVLRRADSVRVVSENIKKQVEHFAVHAKVKVLPVYINVEHFRNISRTSKSDLLGKVILWIGRFEAEKDPLLALSVVSKIPDAKLVMLGAGSLESVLKQKAKNLPASPISGLGPRVEFPGWQDPVPYLQTADVVLCTSRHESWGASIIEALAAGVPVVAPDVGIAKEAGAIVVPHQQLAEKVIEVLNTGVRGELQLHLPTAERWAELWKKTLL